MAHPCGHSWHQCYLVKLHFTCRSCDCNVNSRRFVPALVCHVEIRNYSHSQAMAATDSFRASAIVVPRTRFAPVKKCNDLLLLRSDAYLLENNKPVLNPACGGSAPVMALDSKKYKLVGALEEATAGGIPSLVKCTKLKISGLVSMTKDTVFVGDVTIVNKSDTRKAVPTGEVTGEIDLTEA